MIRRSGETRPRWLVVQTAFLGDVVLTLPLLGELRRAHPEACLTVVATASGARLLETVEAIDEVLVLDKRWDRAGLTSLAGLVRRLRRRRWAGAIAAQRSARTGSLLFLSGARLRIGFAGAPGAWAYDRRVPWEPDRHAVHRYLALAGPAGGEPAAADPQPRLVPPPAAMRRLERLLGEYGLAAGDEILVLAPGSVRATKRWSAEGFARVAAAAPSRGLVPVIVGAPAEADLCRRVAELAGPRVRSFAGRTGVPELTALLARAAAAVTNDSGPAHIAAAVGTPVVTVFGPTAPEFGYTAFGRAVRAVAHADLDCRPCDRRGPRRCPLGHHACMGGLGPEPVLAALDELLRAADDESRPARRAQAGVRPG